MTGRRTGLTGTASPADILAADCPARRVLSLIGDKWTPVVIYGLSGGVQRFSELQHRIADISKKMLIQVLRELACAGLVERTVYPQIPLNQLKPAFSQKPGV